MDCRGRLLAFDSASARRYGAIRAAHMNAGLPIAPIDARIAAIAKAAGAALATRNIRDFRDCGIRLVNPWEDALGAVR